MALTTWDAFNEFYDRIQVSPQLRAKVKQRQSAVIDALRRAFPSTADIRYRSTTLTGSLGRGTASNPADDMDLLVHLSVDNSLWDSGYSSNSSDFLYRVKNTLNSASTVQKIGARGQAVRLFYSDNLTVDVAAVEKYTDGSFAIPDGHGNWLKTNPLKHAEYIDARNAELGGNLKRFVQIVKQWNMAHGSRLQSFHLEMLAARTFSKLGANSRDALEIFFRHNLNNLRVEDPAGFSGDLSTYLTPAQAQLVNQSLQTALDRAHAANKAANSGDHREAIRLWRIILGDNFPIYS
ncbi:SMODS domain-containing nucleotidyltransferase [Bifidobacterium tibiigranuli]|jgi:hypothetical protein|uniref:SMODS domain-containing nucleotidyltransferase n=1 Tax=Bifidobacterium tibiigranuli TaxID=2172043 RepID=UPI0026F340BA|nr:hypothetical protein [Bifidobacterium tibiigranuli]MCI1712645.1 hypothetical protein [Bifidobacterium tibiigranuli]